jgi:hypothetical protein
LGFLFDFEDGDGRVLRKVCKLLPYHKENAKGHLRRAIKKTTHQRNTETTAFKKRHEEGNTNDVTEGMIFY